VGSSLGRNCPARRLTTGFSHLSAALLISLEAPCEILPVKAFTIAPLPPQPSAAALACTRLGGRLLAGVDRVRWSDDLPGAEDEEGPRRFVALVGRILLASTALLVLPVRTSCASRLDAPLEIERGRRSSPDKVPASPPLPPIGRSMCMSVTRDRGREWGGLLPSWLGLPDDTLLSALHTSSVHFCDLAEARRGGSCLGASGAG